MFILFFLSFFFCVQQCSSFLSFHLCPFSIVLYLFLFLFFFLFLFIINCSFTVPFFFFSFNPISTSLCLYLNTITIGSLPRLFNFNPKCHKLSLVYNKTFSIAYEHPSFFFSCTTYPGCSFLNNPNFYQFGQQHFPIQNNSKSGSVNFHYT